MKKLYSFLSKNVFLAALVLLGTFATAQAQVPQFYNFNAAGGTNIFPLATTSQNKVQWIYPPNVFNSMGSLGGTPAFAGNITEIYFRLGNSNQPTFTDLTISLAQNVGTQGSWASSVYNVGMQQVFSVPTYTMTGAVSGQWWGITLQTPFLYDPTQSLVFEMKQSGYTNGGMQVEQISNAFSGGRIWGGLTATVGNGNDNNAVDFGFDLIPATPCTGQPTAGSITPANPTVCAGQTTTMGLTGTTLAGNMTYQWQSAPTAAGPWTNVSTNLSYTTPSLTATAYYRFIIGCTTSALFDTTAVNTVTVSPPSYATLPYTQDFETWTNYCNINDAPNDFHWTGSPLSGNDSWRRNDQGGSASWTIPGNGMYNPASSSGQYSARYHSYYGSATGNLDLYVDCSSSTGTKTLAFDYINISGNDVIQIEFSTNGGTFFIPLQSFNNSATWQTQYVTIPSNSATTIIRFSAMGNSNFSAASDIGLDNVQVLPPCTGAPVAGIIDSIQPCANQPFNLTVSGSTQAGGLLYNWESAPNATGPWTAIGSTPGPTISTTIPGATYFRCILTCTATNQSDTTPVRYIDVGSFWICYCQNQATVVNFENIGNVLLGDTAGNPAILNNGNPLPLTNNLTSTNVYSNFTAIAPPTLFKDSAYDLKVSGIAFDAFFSTSYSAAYIDFNRDGVYDPLNEKIFGNTINFNNNQSATAQFIVPANANFGLTGMRVVLNVFGSSANTSPCGSYNYGETEDYVVNIAPSPCISPPNAGTMSITDTATCPGTAIVMYNTTYDKIYAGLTSSWQSSVDGVNYNDILGGSVDTLTVNPVVDTWYRFRVTCNGTSSAYSNLYKVSMLPPASCFGLSATTGTLNDTSDIGAVVMSTPQPTNINLYTYSSGGPHLLNPAANRFYTNYTPTGTMDLYADSTYKLSIYHIMRTATHGDAKVTVFIDYNNNFNFDLPSELVYSGIADVNNYFLNGQIQIPANVALGVPLAMRVVLNNDIGPNGPSDTGYGTYVSGETEDFFVRFEPNIVTSVNDFNDLTEIGLYPNPTTGLVYIGFNATKTLDVDIDVMSVTGAKVLSKHIDNVSGNYSTTIDLSGIAQGVYLMKFTTDQGDFVRRITVE